MPAHSLFDDGLKVGHVVQRDRVGRDLVVGEGGCGGQDLGDEDAVYARVGQNCEEGCADGGRCGI